MLEPLAIDRPVPLQASLADLGDVLGKVKRAREQLAVMDADRWSAGRNKLHDDQVEDLAAVELVLGVLFKQAERAQMDLAR